MKINWSIIGGFCLGSLVGVLGMKAYEFFPDQPDQGWACIVMFIFACIYIVAASHVIGES